MGKSYIDIANQYLSAGLAVLPAERTGDAKRVALPTWKAFQKRLPTADEVQQWFANNGHNAVCLAAGIASGNLEMLDFDQQGELFDRWAAKIPAELFARLVVERTPTGGYHVIYRCEIPVCGNIKLASRRIGTPDNAEVEIKGKKFKPRKDGDTYTVTVTLIETRGAGGMFLCAPSPGYEIMRGDIAFPPTLTEAERDTILAAAWDLNEVNPQAQAIPHIQTPELRPGDDYNKRGDISDTLKKNGWQLVRDQENQYWRRPGKAEGWSATLKDRVFYVHSSNADPFKPLTGYAPFAVYALLEHRGDYAAASAALRHEGFGEDQPFIATTPPPEYEPEPDPEPQPADPGTLPVELLRVPGFISEVMDYTLSTAPYPNQVLAFCGALALQAFLAGQRVKDSANNRTNLYLLALANSGTGKDHPRKVNQKIAVAAGLSKCVGDQFASGQGLEDRMGKTSNMLYQVDEIDHLLAAINRVRDARQEFIIQTLLRFYSCSNGQYAMRDKAISKQDRDREPEIIEQPSLCIFGTAVPKFYYGSLDSKLLNNGFFARLIILDAGDRGSGQDPGELDVPPRLIETAKWWRRIEAGANLSDLHPHPRIVPAVEAAVKLLTETRIKADQHYFDARRQNDTTAMTIWARAMENTRKLSLIYAASENHKNPMITEAAASWAWAIVEQLTKRMLFQAGCHVAENTFDADCLKLLGKLREAGGEMPHWLLLKRMHLKKKQFTEMIETLVERGQIEEIREAKPNGGWSKHNYCIRQ